MHNYPTNTNLWARIESTLDGRLPDWRSRIEHFGQVSAIEDRLSGKTWDDNEIQEGLVKAVLSSNTDWAKIDGVLPELHQLFHNFSLEYYAQLTDADIERDFVPWFKCRKAASMTLGNDLKRLVKTSQILSKWSQYHGSAEHCFTSLFERCNKDSKQVAFKIGLPESKYKLPAFGVALAAETLRNIGFDLAKPDRHILRAAGAFGFVRFSRWTDSSGTRPPTANPAELLSAMTALENFAASENQRTAYLDNAIWLLCAKSGLGLSNAELRGLGS
jgi:hypothetical protein